MLKFEGIAVGTIIKAYDFEPMKGRTDRYVVGEIVRAEVEGGAKFHVIMCSKDSSFPKSHSRVGHEIYVPMEMCMDFDCRVVEMSKPLTVKAV